MSVASEKLILEIALKDGLTPGMLAQEAAFDQLLGSMRAYDDQASAGLGMAELGKRIEQTNDTIIEYGGSVHDVEMSHVALGVAAAKTGKPLALLTKLQEKLADEADSGAAAHEHMAGAVLLLENSHLKAEDAGAAYGKIIRGETDALKELGAAGDRLHKSLEGITDAHTRGKLGAKAMEAAIASNNSITTKYENALASTRARLDIFATRHKDLVTVLKAGHKAAQLSAQGLNAMGKVAGQALGATAKVATAAATAIGGGLVAAVKSYLGNSVAMQKQNKALDKAFKRFTFTLGGTIVKAGGLDKIMGLVTKTFGRLSEWVLANQKQIGEWVRGFISGGVKVAKAATFIAGGLARFIAFVGDMIGGLLRKFESFFSIGELFQQAAGPLEELGFISWDTMKAMEGMGKTMSKLGKQEAFNFDATTKADAFFSDLETKIDGLGDDIEAELQKAGSQMEKTGRVHIGRRLGDGAVSELQKMLLEVAQKSVIQNMPGFANLALQVATGADKVNFQLVKHRAMAEEASKAVDVLKSKNLGDAFAAEFQKGLDKQKEWKAAGIDPLNDSLETTLEKFRNLENLKFFRGEMVSGLNAMTDATFGLVGALASGQLAFKDLGAAAADAVGDVIMQSGQNLMKYALTSAGVFQAFGAAFSALGSMSPLGLFGGGALLFAAGAGLKAFLGSGGGGAGGQSRADTATASTIERTGRQLMDRSDDRGPGGGVIVVGDRQIGAYVIDKVDDYRSRREGMAPATGVLD